MKKVNFLLLMVLIFATSLGNAQSSHTTRQARAFVPEKRSSDEESTTAQQELQAYLNANNGKMCDNNCSDIKVSWLKSNDPTFSYFKVEPFTFNDEDLGFLYAELNDGSWVDYKLYSKGWPNSYTDINNIEKATGRYVMFTGKVPGNLYENYRSYVALWADNKKLMQWLSKIYKRSGGNGNQEYWGFCTGYNKVTGDYYISDVFKYQNQGSDCVNQFKQRLKSYLNCSLSDVDQNIKVFLEYRHHIGNVRMLRQIDAERQKEFYVEQLYKKVEGPTLRQYKKVKDVSFNYTP